jgi:hypothetical protein
MNYNMIHPCQSLHPSALFPSDFHTKFLYEFPVSNMYIITYLNVLCLNLIILISSKEYSYEALHYAVLSIFLLVLHFYGKALSLTPCCQTPTISDLHIHIKQAQLYTIIFPTINFYIGRPKACSKYSLNLI